ncbi:MAG: NYN domain-containing protein [Nitrococcus mobilis]|nr:NYN domain-containing protein [Nitrococcus mobilis]
MADIDPPRTVEVIKTEEKGSDVNLAVHLVNDAWADRYDCAVVVSNDSDLAEAIRIVRGERGKLVGLIPPGGERGRRVSGELGGCCDFIRTLRRNTLRCSLLPSPIPGTELCKPPNW